MRRSSREGFGAAAATPLERLAAYACAALAVLLSATLGCAAGRAGCRDLRAELTARERAGGLILGEGSAPLGSADAEAAAREKALAALAAQIRVHIESETQLSEGITGSGDAAVEERSLQSRLLTRSAVTLEGAEVFGSCSDGESAFTFAGLDRARFADQTARRLAAVAGQASEGARRGSKV